MFSDVVPHTRTGSVVVVLVLLLSIVAGTAYIAGHQNALNKCEERK